MRVPHSLRNIVATKWFIVGMVILLVALGGYATASRSRNSQVASLVPPSSDAPVVTPTTPAKTEPSSVLPDPKVNPDPPPSPPPSQVTTDSTLNCSDCWLAAIDKTNALSPHYAPSVIASQLAGDGSLTPDTQAAAHRLFAAAHAAGTPLKIVSAYRSYATQQSTFESWVSVEMSNGLDRAAAETAANTYSAKPGHSEHQLGTTIDIACNTCAAFDAASNANAYAFIEKNAHLHGFVISYPRNMEAATGYTYEPWHIRYVGKHHAAALHATGYVHGNGNFIAKYLRDNGLSQ